MKVEYYITFSKDEINKNIPYALVCETMGGSRWDTGKRRRLMKEQFTADEIDATYRLHRQAREWYLYKGAPDEIKLTPKTLALWNKLADFCYQL